MPPKARRRGGPPGQDGLPVTAGDKPGGDGRHWTFVHRYTALVLLMLGAGEAWSATTWRNPVGAGVGAAGALLGAACLWLRPRSATLFRGRAAILLLGIYLSLLLLVRLRSFDSALLAFPAQCSAAKLQGCARVATEGSHPATGDRPPQYEVTVSQAISAVEAWAAREPGTSLLLKRNEPASSILLVNSPVKCIYFMHYRAVSRVWGLADDLFVNVECIREAKAAMGTVAPLGPFVRISAQSQLRLGLGDFGVNRRRVQRLLSSLQAALAPLPAADCTQALSNLG
eukprot:SM000087S23321  [mRNA]  locus=s87:22254:24702:+ [translate_table: standard]